MRQWLTTTCWTRGAVLLARVGPQERVASAGRVQPLRVVARSRAGLRFSASLAPQLAADRRSARTRTDRRQAAAERRRQWRVVLGRFVLVRDAAVSCVTCQYACTYARILTCICVTCMRCDRGLRITNDW